VPQRHVLSEVEGTQWAKKSGFVGGEVETDPLGFAFGVFAVQKKEKT
jgi:hypothetical protein